MSPDPGDGRFSPHGRDPEQRRFDFGVVALTFGLIVVLVAGLSVVARVRDAHQAKARARAAAAAKAAAEAAQIDAVKQAYLAYWMALGQAYSQRSVAPLQAYTTPAGAEQEAKTMQPFIQSGYRYALTADHDLQIVVYSEGQLASIDDNLLQHSTPLDATTMQPVGQEKLLPIHSSVVLRLQESRWLVDSRVSFGADGSDPGAGISYAAVSRANPAAPELRWQIERAYLRYWEARRLAYQNLDPTPLQQTILEPALGSDTDLLQQQRQKNQGFTIRIEHNDRIAMKDPNTAYVYDTFADSSFYFDIGTKLPILSGSIKVRRETYEMVKLHGLWKVDQGALNK